MAGSFVLFLGYTVPTIPHTANFNNSQYGELDIVQSVLRGMFLHLSTGRDSDEQKYYTIRIEGFGEVDREIGYYDDALFVWGKWFRDTGGVSPSGLGKDFLGVVSGLKKGITSFHLELNPKKVT